MRKSILRIMEKTLFIIILMVLIVTSGCVIPFDPFGRKDNEYTNTDKIESLFTEDFPHNVAKLHPINIDVNSYENFVIFADSINSLIDLLNRQEMYDIPKIEVTSVTWNKAMNAIETYGPLIGSYNEVISSARIYEISPTSDNFRIFYINTASFAIEVILIYDIAVANPSILRAIMKPAIKQLETLTITITRLSKINKYCPTCYTTIVEKVEDVIMQTLKEDLLDGAGFIMDQIIRPFQTNTA